jgi:hypothetical protein
MRRHVPFFMAPVLALTALLNAGCEDGPNQTYSPAPANAGNIWNGPAGAGGLGDGGSFVGTSTEGYDASFGGTNLNQLCNATTEKAVWTSLFSQAIAVPGVAGGIDIAGGYSTAPEGNCKGELRGRLGLRRGATLHVRRDQGDVDRGDGRGRGGHPLPGRRDARVLRRDEHGRLGRVARVQRGIRGQQPPDHRPPHRAGLCGRPRGDERHSDADEPQGDGVEPLDEQPAPHEERDGG